MKISCLFSIFIVTTIISCDNNLDRIMRDQDEIIALSQNKEIVNDEERNFYMLATYIPSENKKNEYFFNKEKKGENVFYTLFRDSIQFFSDDVININKDDHKYWEKVCNYYLKVSRILKSYRIKSLIGNIYKSSPQLTIYLQDGGILIYQPKVVISKNKNFEKIKDDWYLLK